MGYPANTLPDAPVIDPKSALSPLRPTPMFPTNTVLELPVSLALCGIHGGGLGGNAGFLMKCGATLLPLTNIGLPFANTVYCDASTGAVVEHLCPVLHLSLFLDILGMPVFMDCENRWCYSLSYKGTMDLQIAVRPSFKTLVTLQSYPVIDDNILSSVVFLPFADKPISTAPLA